MNKIFIIGNILIVNREMTSIIKKSLETYKELLLFNNQDTNRIYLDPQSITIYK
jgi:hypothetical protein